MGEGLTQNVCSDQTHDPNDGPISQWEQKILKISEHPMETIVAAIVNIISTK